MRMSNIYMPTLKEVPSEAEIPSHQLLLRAGMIRNSVSGSHSYLPLGYRVIRKIEQIVREEMDIVGSQEIMMSSFQQKELLEATDNLEEFGEDLFKLYDRNNAEFFLGFKDEESFVNLIKDELKSYKQLPLSLYQIQTKYRDEKRPRFGLIRSKEFIMKDAYSFDAEDEKLESTYQNMLEAYEKIFKRLNLDCKVVQVDTGKTGDESHEFMAVSDLGENLFACCSGCNYAATDEKAQVLYKEEEEERIEMEMEKIYTPQVTTIEDLVDFLGVDSSDFGKALVFMVREEPIIAMIPGDRELNETKLCNYLGIKSDDLEMADERIIMDITGADKGFTGPIDLKEETRLLVDSRLSKLKNLVVGGNETDYHIKNVNYGRDFKGELVEDLLLVEENDICPECGGALKLDKGIGVGSLVKIGARYTRDLDANYLDENGKSNPFSMGHYGIGISKTMAALVEQFHDEEGIIWPLNSSPYGAVITVININKEEQMELGESLYRDLKSWGVEVLLDDRKERAGVKFKDRDLIGIPLRITVGKRAGENIVEYSIRGEGDKLEVEEKEIKSLVRKLYEKNDMPLI